MYFFFGVYADFLNSNVFHKRLDQNFRGVIWTLYYFSKCKLICCFLAMKTRASSFGLSSVIFLEFGHFSSGHQFISKPIRTVLLFSALSYICKDRTGCEGLTFLSTYKLTKKDGSGVTKLWTFLAKFNFQIVIKLLILNLEFIPRICYN